MLNNKLVIGLLLLGLTNNSINKKRGHEDKSSEEPVVILNNVIFTGYKEYEIEVNKVQQTIIDDFFLENKILSVDKLFEELLIMQEEEKNLTKKKIEYINKVSSFTGIIEEFNMVIKKNNANIPINIDKLSVIYNYISPIVNNLKSRYNLVRPRYLAQQLDLKLNPYLRKHGSSAFPSGTSTFIYTIAYYLSEINPEGTEDYLNKAQEISYCRVLSGVHYPSDIDYGKKLAKKITEKKYNIFLD